MEDKAIEIETLGLRMGYCANRLEKVVDVLLWEANLGHSGADKFIEALTRAVNELEKADTLIYDLRDNLPDFEEDEFEPDMSRFGMY